MIPEVKSVPAPLLTACGQTVKLGMVPPKAPPKVLRLKAFLLAPVAVPIPPGVDYTPKARASLNRMYLNDQKGCCVISAKGHSLGVWSANDGAATITLTDNQVAQLYAKLAVYPGQDSGCIITDVLDYLSAYGFPDDKGGNHKIDGYVAVDVSNRDEVKTAIYLFGALTIGFAVTNDMIRSAREGAVWSGFNPNDVAGGHDVSIVGYDSTGVKVSTWGLVLTMAWSVFQNQQCVSECYAPLAPDWYGDDKINAATGLDVTALKKALDQLKGGQVPPIPDPVPVVPPPPVPPVVPPPPVPPVVLPIGRIVAKQDWLGNIKGTVTFDAPKGFHLPTLDDLKEMLNDAIAVVGSDAALSLEAAAWKVVQDAKDGKYGQAMADAAAVVPAAVFLWKQIVALLYKWRGTFGALPAGGWLTDHMTDLMKLLEDLLALVGH